MEWMNLKIYNIMLSNLSILILIWIVNIEKNNIWKYIGQEERK
jgi:hypothetical protein